MSDDSLEYRKIWYWRRNTTRKPDRTGKRAGKSSLQYNWHEIDKVINEQLWKLEEKHGFKPTLRELNYALISLLVLPNLGKAYGSLDKYMTNGREKGVFSVDCLSDERHPIVNVNDVYYSPEVWIEYNLDKLGHISETFHDGNEFFPRWRGQKNYVEIWTEKQAMAKHFIYIVNKENLQVRIVPFGGFPGFTELNECVNRLKKKMKEGKNVYVLWFGDLDPSGESIDRSTEERLGQVPDWRLPKYAFDHDVEYKLERIAITKRQIIDYKLPWNTNRLSEEEQEKLQDDPRFKNHLLEHGEVYACEVDSLPTIYPDEFNEIVVKAVNQYFDDDRYKRYLDRHKEKYPEKYVNDSLDYQVREFLDGINMKLKWEWLES